MSVQDLVTEFHRVFGVDIGARPSILSDQRRGLRLDLLLEEVAEVVKEYDEEPLTHLDRLCKELADVVYVAYGWAVEMGVDLDAVIAEVHRSNMSKLGPDGKPILRRDGKVLKGPRYSEANVARLIWGAT